MTMYVTLEITLTVMQMTVFSVQQNVKNVLMTLNANSVQTVSISLMVIVSKTHA